MKSLNDKAQTLPEIKLAKQSSPGAYVMLAGELYEADEISEEDKFPEFGDFLPVMGTSEAQLIECPSGLAQWLVDNEIEIGDGFRIQSVQKIDNRLSYTVVELGEEEMEAMPKIDDAEETVNRLLTDE